MVDVSASIDGAAVKSVGVALNGMAAALGDISKDAPKVMALRICNSLHKDTKKAKKKKKKADWGAIPIKHTSMTEWFINGRKYLIPTPSPYITNPRNGRHGLSNGLMLHRYMFTTRKGTSDARTFPVAAYSRLKHTKRGIIVTDKTAELREIKEIHAENRQSGLAANSWLWIKRDIANKGTDPVYRRRKNDRRDPKKAVKGTYIKTNAGASATIENKIDYISIAVNGGAVDRAIQNAAIKQVYMDALNSLRRSGMSAEEAAAKARQTASVFKHDVLNL